MIQRRSISAPSSPKLKNMPLPLQRDSSLIDTLDLGDDDHGDVEDEEDVEEEQTPRDVLEDSDHSIDDSSVTDDAADYRGHLRKKQSTKVVYGNTRSLRRRRLRRGLKSKYNANEVSEDNSTTTDEPHQIEDDDLYDDTQESKSKSIQSESEEEVEEEE